jgi:hypothetical protein
MKTALSFQHFDESILGNFNVANFAHLFLSFRLPLQQLHLSADISAILKQYKTKQSVK